MIKVRKYFDSYSVMVGGCYQLDPYMTALWRKMLKNIYPEYKTKTVLMLGLGGGGGIEAVRKKFPDAHITAVEHDPVMVDLARKMTFKEIGYSPELIIDDANNALKSFSLLGKKFDIVILDIFVGANPSPLYSNEFLLSLSGVLSKNGYLLTNFYKKEKELTPVFKAFFSSWKRVRYKNNRMRVYRHFGLGNIGDPLPKGLINKEQSHIFSRSIIQPRPSEIIEVDGVIGLRYCFGPLAIEVYTSETEPVPKPWRGIRLIFWFPITNTRSKKGWSRNLLVKSGRQEGFVQLSTDFSKFWSKHAQRHLKKWKENTNYATKRQ